MRALSPLIDDSTSAHFSCGGGGASAVADDRKKRPRTAFTAAQIKALEAEFEKNKYLSVSKRMQLSKQLKLTETQVGVDYVIKLQCVQKFPEIVMWSFSQL